MTKWINIGASALAAVAAGWGVWTGLRAKRELEDCDSRIDTLKTELKEARTFDEVTGALNYQAFSKSAYIQLRLAHRHQWPISLLVIDVVDLERINLKRGYKVGNAILKAVAEAIFHGVRSSDVVGRFEGSKFFIILQECGEAYVPIVLKRIVERLQEDPPIWNEQPVPFEYRAASITSEGKEAFLQEMMDEVEKGLHEARARGEKFVRIKSARGDGA